MKKKTIRIMIGRKNFLAYEYEDKTVGSLEIQEDGSVKEIKHNNKEELKEFLEGKVML